MFSKILKFGTIVGLSLLFTSCSRPAFQVTQLTPEANRVAISQIKPRDCVPVSEKEGVANVYQAQLKKVSRSANTYSENPFTMGGGASTQTSSEGSLIEKTDPKKTKATREQLVESAKNDLLNKAALLEVSKGKRLVVYYGEEKWICGNQRTCLNRKGELKINQVTSLRISGEIYECNL